MTKFNHKCETCGTPVRVIGDGETKSYESAFYDLLKKSSVVIPSTSSVWYREFEDGDDEIGILEDFYGHSVMEVYRFAYTYNVKNPNGLLPLPYSWACPPESCGWVYIGEF